MTTQRYPYRIIQFIPVGSRIVQVYSYITTDHDLTLEHYDPEEGTPARLWIDESTYIEFEHETVIEQVEA